MSSSYISGGLSPLSHVPGDSTTVLDKVKEDLVRIQSDLRAGRTTKKIARAASNRLQDLQSRLTQTLENERSKGTLKTKRSLRDMAKNVLKSITKVKVEAGIDQTTAAREEKAIMAKFELDSQLALQVGSHDRAWTTTVDLPATAFATRATDTSQADYIPPMPAYSGGQPSEQQPRHKLTSKSAASLSTQGYYTSNRHGNRSSDSQYATQDAQSSSPYAYPSEGYNPVRRHEREYANYLDNPEHSLQHEAGRQNRDPRYAPQNYEGRSYEATSHASRPEHWEREHSYNVNQPEGRHSIDARSYASYPGSSESLTTMEFEDRSEIESQNLNVAAVSEHSNEVRPRARAGVFWVPGQSQFQEQWPASGRF